MRSTFLPFFVSWGLTLLLTLPQTSLANETEVPPLCSMHTTPQGTLVADSDEALDNCIEFGAAVGELSLSWRQKLPDNVRWLTRKDAPDLCEKTQTELGKKVGGPLPRGCIFLAIKTCTIVTAGYISHAALGNAVRECVPD